VLLLILVACGATEQSYSVPQVKKAFAKHNVQLRTVLARRGTHLDQPLILGPVVIPDGCDEADLAVNVCGNEIVRDFSE